MSTSLSLLQQPIVSDHVPHIPFGDLAIGEWIGHGAFSQVFQTSIRKSSFEPQPNRGTLAVKLLRTDTHCEEAYEAARDGIIQEIAILSSLPNHSNIISLHGVSVINDHVCLVMDRLHTTLSTYLDYCREGPKMYPKCNWHRRVKDVAIGLVKGLQFLHKNGVVHRDIKPSNIGFDDSNNVVLFDFGLSRTVLPNQDDDNDAYQGSLDSLGVDLLEEDDDTESEEESVPAADQSVDSLTIECTTAAGTVKYMAPEIARCHDYGVSSDVYSFGILLWEVVTLRTPYRRLKTRREVRQAVVKEGRRPNIRALPANKTLRRLVHACWSDTPTRRPNTRTISAQLDKILLDSTPPCAKKGRKAGF